MKTLQLKMLLLSFSLLLLLASCQKSVEVNKKISTQSGDDLTNNLFFGNHCLVTSTKSSPFGKYDIFYNIKNNPDSIRVGDVTLYARYNKWGKLIRETASRSYAHLDYFYKNVLFPFPTLVEYYNKVNGIDSLLATFYFQYDSKGKLISFAYHDQPFDINYYGENYLYDPLGNVIKVLYYNIFGSYTEYTISRYDDKPNFMSGSPWTKFLLLQTRMMYHTPYWFMLFSRNNAADWKTYDEQGDEIKSCISTFEYNKQGFANKIKIDCISFGSESFLIRTSSSTCDDNSQP